MSTSDLIKVPGGSQDKGINTFDPDISAEVTWDESTVNVSGGIRRGVGVRYGMAPLAGHSNTEALTGEQANGIQKSEAATGAGLQNRKTIYGIIPLTMTAYDGSYPKPNKQFYLYLVGLTYSSDISIDACVGATCTAGNVNKQANTLVAGLAQSSYREESPLVRLHKTELLNLPLTATPTAADVQAILKQVGSRYWMPYAHIAVSGKRVPYQWMYGRVTAVGDATTAPNINTWSKTVTVGTNATVLGGMPSEMITREFVANDQRLLTVYTLGVDSYPLGISYTKQITSANTVSQPAYSTSANYTALTGATKTGGTNYADQSAVLINDPGSYTNTRHDAVLIAGETPLALVYQDWLVAVRGMMPRWVDLTSPGCTPRQGLNLYPNFSTTPSGFVGMNASDGLNIGSEGSGVLLPGRSYDIGYSYYNKLLDYECNVTFGTTQQTGGAADEEGRSIFPISWTVGTDNLWKRFIATPTGATVPWEYSDTAPVAGALVGRGQHINDYEIRFYYRETGTVEWLPAGKFDAANFWFYASWPSSGATPFYGPQICTGPAAGLPGGQPNGFVDYSPLPKQRYICTVTFQNRAFWWSEKTMQFSLLNNIYAYPTRNIIAASTGKWRGGIVHIRSGEVEQTSRLVCFGDVTYVGVFTGNKTYQNVRISAETVGQFEVDGSDFRMDYLCEATAFSFRSACVGDGVLFFWGPQGVYMDDGITTPKKISGVYEPEIFQFVDMARDQEVHCVYNKRTSEVIWFYPPKTADATFPTYGLVYNKENGKFYNYKFRCQVDSSQTIRLENDETPDLVDGERILLHCRETTASTVQRTFYFDDLVLAGEQGPARELTVLTVATPSTGSRRLTLAAGSVGITAGSIAVGDFIAIQNAKGYAPSLTLASDMVAKITAINNGSNYIDILLPDDGELDASATLTNQTAFPIYHRKPTTAGLSGITYLMQTNYWLPNGMSNSYLWLYFYFLFKYGGWPTPTDATVGGPIGAPITLAYSSLAGGGPVSETIRLQDNSNGHCQIHHPMKNTNTAASGQALKYSLAGIHIGNPWTLEYLEAHLKEERGFTLKRFEG